MSSSKNTDNYLLPVFEADDKPGWLTDWNTAMVRIDAILAQNHTDIVKLANRVTALEEGGGGGGGTTDFDKLINRPKYNGEEMTSETNIPDLSETVENLTETISTETKQRTSADTALQTSITENSNKITELETNVNENITNINNNSSKILTLETDLATETNLRVTSDNNLQSQIDSLVSKSDVVDTINTYADLQAYDTTGLAPKDVIIVLNDETKEAATSYYRWSDPTEGEWNYIGSIAAYYSKSEANGLFVPQTRTVNGLSLDKNIEIEIPEYTSQLINNNNLIRIYNYTILTPSPPFSISATSAEYGNLTVNPFPEKRSQNVFIAVSVIVNTSENTTSTDPQILRVDIATTPSEDPTDRTSDYFNIPLPSIPPNNFVKLAGFIRFAQLKNKFIISVQSNIANPNLKINNSSINLTIMTMPA